MMQLRKQGGYVYKYMQITSIYAYTKLTYLQSNMFRPTYIGKLTHTHTHIRISTPGW